MADEQERQPHLRVRRISDGAEFAVTERQYRYRMSSEDFEDAGSTDLSVDEVPIHDEIGLPKVEALRKGGFRRVGDLRAASVEDISEADGVGEKTAEKIKAKLASA